jgi:predicted transcriptional regulator YheO
VTDGRRLWATVRAAVESELGHPLPVTPTTRRRRAVELLAAAGAFELRGGVSLTASALGVSRYTIYGVLRRLQTCTVPATGR